METYQRKSKNIHKKNIIYNLMLCTKEELSIHPTYDKLIDVQKIRIKTKDS